MHARRSHIAMLLHLISSVIFFYSLPQTSFLFFFFNDTATTEIYTLSLHDALPIFPHSTYSRPSRRVKANSWMAVEPARSEEHTSELQSHLNLVCRLLLEKKKNKNHTLSQFIASYEAIP